MIITPPNNVTGLPNHELVVDEKTKVWLTPNHVIFPAWNIILIFLFVGSRVSVNTTHVGCFLFFQTSKHQVHIQHSFGDHFVEDSDSSVTDSKKSLVLYHGACDEVCPILPTYKHNKIIACGKYNVLINICAH